MIASLGWGRWWWGGGQMWRARRREQVVKLVCLHVCTMLKHPDLSCFPHVFLTELQKRLFPL